MSLASKVKADSSASSEEEDARLRTQDTPDSLKEIVRPILPQLNEVEKKLAAIAEECEPIHNGEGILKDSSRYVLSGGGKRFRASLVLFCASIPSDKNFPHRVFLRSQSSIFNLQSAIEIATAVELIHSATLVHDDIIDRAVLRRLKPTVHVQFGEEVAILLGDFLYARAFEMIANVGDTKITEWLSQTTKKMCEGELDQLRHRYQADLTLEQYLSFIERKTASLISASARCGARMASLPVSAIESLAAYGFNIGIAYQMIDDLLDIVGTEPRLGKTMRTDAGNGKLTLPMIFLKEALAEQERKKFVQDFQSLKPDWSALQKQIFQFGIVERTEQFAENYRLKACRAIEEIAQPYQNHLQELSSFILSRDY